MIEIMCIHHLKAQYSHLNDLMFIHGVSILSLGILTVLFSYLSRWLLCILKLSTALQVLAFCLIILGGLSFIVLFYTKVPSYSLIAFLITFIFSRGIKYTLYDSAKEIATIPWQNGIKRVGKIADMVGVGSGRFMGHLIPVIIFTFSPYSTYDTLLPVIAGLYAMFALLFSVVSYQLGKKAADIYNAKNKS